MYTFSVNSDVTSLAVAPFNMYRLNRSGFCRGILSRSLLSFAGTCILAKYDQVHLDHSYWSPNTSYQALICLGFGILKMWLFDINGSDWAGREMVKWLNILDLSNMNLPLLNLGGGRNRCWFLLLSRCADFRANMCFFRIETTSEGIWLLSLRLELWWRLALNMILQRIKHEQ